MEIVLGNIGHENWVTHGLKTEFPILVVWNFRDVIFAIIAVWNFRGSHYSNDVSSYFCISIVLLYVTEYILVTSLCFYILHLQNLSLQ